MSNDAAMAMMGVGVIFGVLIALIIAVFFLLTLSRTLAAVKTENRQMEPGLVWLNLIPVFNLFWMFYTVIRLGDSVVKEAADRSLDLGDGGKTLGIVYAALVISSIIPVIGILTSLAGLVVYVIYWVKIAGFKNQLVATAG